MHVQSISYVLIRQKKQTQIWAVLYAKMNRICKTIQAVWTLQGQPQEEPICVAICLLPSNQGFISVGSSFSGDTNKTDITRRHNMIY